MVAKISKSFLVNLISYLFILLFVYASVSKLLEFQDFQTQLGQSPLLGAFAMPISFGVIGVELGLAVMLCLEKYRRMGLYGSFVLMVMFTAYIIIILNFTSFTPCSCGGVLESLGWTEHLIFNVVFIALAALGIYLMERRFSRPFVYRLMGLKVLGSFIVILIFLSSEKEIKRNNAFQRNFLVHGLEDSGNIQLESNSFYIAGVDSNWIYLGNYYAPLYIHQYSWDLSQKKIVKFTIDNLDLPFRRIKTQVNSPFLFVGDGSVPILFRGNMIELNARTFSYDAFYFIHFLPKDSSEIYFTASSASTQNTVVGRWSNGMEEKSLKLNESFLSSQGKGMFDTDGILMWNEQRNQILYVYYYRNQYEVGDTQLGHVKTCKTIDTISRAQLDVAHYKKGDFEKLGKSVLVNLSASTWGNHLYIQSDRMGKFENEEVLNAASILDRYDIDRNEYIGSFYYHHQPSQKIREFKVFEDKIIALVDDELWVRRVNPAYSQE